MLIKDWVDTYKPNNAEELHEAMREIMQEIAQSVKMSIDFEKAQSPEKAAELVEAPD